MMSSIYNTLILRNPIFILKHDDERYTLNANGEISDVADWDTNNCNCILSVRDNI